MNVEDKSFNSLSSSLCVSEPHRTKQRICFREEKKNGNKWQVWLFDFQITQASFLLTWRVNKYIIQLPWSHTIRWQSSKRSNRLLQGTWATLKKSWLYERCWHREQSHKKRQTSYPQKQLPGEPPVLKPAGLPATALCTQQSCSHITSQWLSVSFTGKKRFAFVAVLNT